MEITLEHKTQDGFEYLVKPPCKNMDDEDMPKHCDLTQLFYCNDSRRKGCCYYIKLEIDTPNMLCRKDICGYNLRRERS